MYDAARRVAIVKKRVREHTRRQQHRSVCALSIACALLFAALMQTAGIVIGPGGFGAMLLRENAGGYMLVAVAAFAAAAAITALCIRLRSRENQKKGGADKPAPQEQEEPKK